ncbi:hypothetical protein CSC43_0543 [Pseudomonas aeruginosa]|nr:hypothetical protein CSC43_0543 [Pseudomonas aeruginosa]
MPGNGMRADHPWDADSVVVPNASEDHDRFSAANQNKCLFALFQGVAQFLLYIGATNSLEFKSIRLADIGHDASNNLLVYSPKLSPRPGHSEELPRS